eukprot:snap_masked-scaffold_54-processed-gene-0.28-mRNA-1 protein AED:1.00 eAED:1.00 QI:0/0/0/0/1/1/4/0/438
MLFEENSSIFCEEDLDCPELKLCYAGYDWIKNDQESICACNTWFGFTGENCTELGNGSFVGIGFGISAIILGMTITFYSLEAFLVFIGIWKNAKERQLRRRSTAAHLYDEETRKRKSSATHSRTTNEDLPLDTEKLGLSANTQKSGWNLNKFSFTTSKKKTSATPRERFSTEREKKKATSSSVTSFFLFLAGLSYTLWSGIVLVIFVTPRNQVLREEDVYGLARAQLLEKKTEPIALVATGALFVLTMLNLSLMWIDNVKKVEKFSKSAKNRAIRYQRSMIFLQITWLCIFYFISPPVIGILAAAFAIVSSFLYIYAHKRMRTLLPKPIDESQERRSSRFMSFQSTRVFWLEELIKRMKKVKQQVIASSVITVSGALMYSILSIEEGWRKNSPVGEVSLPMVGNELMSIGIGLNMLSISLFLRRSALYPLARRRSTTL